MTDTQSPQQGNPYVGPRTFQERDAKHFFGRDREARDLLSLIISEPLVLFFAESGAGKSSLLNAKIIPNLREEGFWVYPVARVGGELPDGVTDVDNIYVFNLLASLSQQTDNHQQLAKTTLVDFMSQPPADLDDPDMPRALIIDQFEEILTTHLQRWQDREKFFKQLRQLVRKDPLLWIVLTMREDYVGSLDPYESLVPGKLRSRYYMQRMEPPAAIKAIQEPAAQAGRPFEKGVAAQLVDNLRQIRTGPDQTVAGQYVEPVQLQVVCYQLWENLRGSDTNTITAADVDKLGNVDDALGDFYESALADVVAASDVSEFNLRNWFERNLITEAATRGTVYQGSEETAGMPNPIVAMLERKFLLRAEIRAGGTWFELIHDRFISPILGANQRWRLTQSPLMRAAEAWDRGDRAPDLLYQDERLAAALSAAGPDTSEPLIEAFLTASEQAQSQRDLENVQKKAAADRQIARRLRALAIALAVFVAAAAVATYFAVTLASRAFTESADAQQAQAAAESKATEAFVMQTTAEANSAVAVQEQAAAVAAANEAATRAAELQGDTEIAAATAEAAQQAATDAQATAVVANEAAATAQAESAIQLSEANNLLNSLQGRFLVAQIPQLLEESNNSELALLYGVQAYNINQRLGRDNENGLIYSSLRNTLAQPIFSGSLLQESATHTLVSHPIGQAVFSGLANGQIRVWNAAEPQPFDINPGEGPVLSLAVYDSGDFLVSGHDSGKIIIWEISRGAEEMVRDLTPLIEWEAHTGPVTALALNPANRLLASAGQDSVIQIWDASIPTESAAEVQPTFTLTSDSIDETRFVFHEGEIFSLAFRPTGQLVSGSENEVIFWDVGSTRVNGVYFLSQPTTDLFFRNGFSISDDGNLLAIPLSSQDFSVYWIPSLFADGDNFRVPFRNASVHVGKTAQVVTFLPGSRSLAVYSSDRQVNIYDTNSVQVSASQQSFSGIQGPLNAMTILNGDAGRILFAGGIGETLRVVYLDYIDPSAELPQDVANLNEVIDLACQQVRRNLTQTEWNTLFPGEPYQKTCPDRPPHFSATSP